ncbi:Carnitine O-acetyltransferase mitochondrial, partial [Ceratobasidium sp. 394]
MRQRRVVCATPSQVSQMSPSHSQAVPFRLARLCWYISEQELSKSGILPTAPRIQCLFQPRDHTRWTVVTCPGRSRNAPVAALYIIRISLSHPTYLHPLSSLFSPLSPRQAVKTRDPRARHIIHSTLMYRRLPVRIHQIPRLTMSPTTRTLQTTAARKSHHAEPQVDVSQPPLLRYETHLPELPVPDLSSTARKYLDSVKALTTDAEFTQTKAAVDEFVASPQAKQLQQRLKDRAATPGIENWLADWWNDVAYMGYRDPVVVFVSYFYVHVEEGGRRSQAERAARIVKSLLPFRDMTESGQLEPEKVRTTPLAMSSYKWLFNSSRYPVKPSDTATKFDPATNNHIVFIRKNRFFEFDVTGLSTADLTSQIQRIIDAAGAESAAYPFGALTSENRDTWADAREHLAKNPNNAEALKRIESAIVVVALDDTKPVTREDVSWACWVGDGKNRFYDKHQFIVFENGKSGFLGEHSCMDGILTPT